MHMKKNGKKSRFRQFPLEGKVAAGIVGTCFVLGAIAVSISGIVYTEKVNERNAQLCRSVAATLMDVMDGDRITAYLAGSAKDQSYYETERQIQLLRDNMETVEYVYVYRIEENGCHVVFDADAPDLPGGELGDVLPIEDAFRPYMPDLLAGRPIAPLVSNDAYGWLMTFYQPIYNSDGATAAYLGVDVQMADVMDDRVTFLVQIIGLMGLAALLITALVMFLTKRLIVKPINALADVAEKFAFSDSMDADAATAQLESLKIATGDEIENLYGALTKMVSDMAHYVVRLQEQSADIKEKAEIIQKMQANIIISFAGMIENRDENTGEHIQRTSRYVQALAEKLMRDGKYDGMLTSAYLENICRSAPLHDIGKIKIPDAILNKPGRLTQEEFFVIKTHAAAGGEILEQSFKGIQDENYLSEAMDMAVYHHEWWDGSGYPRGLSGTDIPLSARIMAVADVLDALTSKRCYKEACSFEEALNIMKAESGTHFDPDIIEALLSIQEELRRGLEEG